MVKDEKELDIKWKYEILPILREYHKDGLIKVNLNSGISRDDFISGKYE